MTALQSVTPDWLHDRADLHDCRVVEVRTVGSVAEIALSDEWASMRGFDVHAGGEAPGVLILEDFSLISGDPSAAAGGWISEAILDGNELRIFLSKRAKLVFRADRIRWRSTR